MGNLVFAGPYMFFGATADAIIERRRQSALPRCECPTSGPHSAGAKVVCPRCGRLGQVRIRVLSGVEKIAEGLVEWPAS